MDGRKNNKGTIGNKGGGIGYGRLTEITEFAKTNFPEYSKQMSSLIKAGDRWALSEFTKIIVKMIPQDHTTGGDKIMFLPTEIILKHDLSDTPSSTKPDSE